MAKWMENTSNTFGIVLGAALMLCFLAGFVLGAIYASK